MHIGVISDSHDDMARIKEAVALVAARKVDYVLHCGDIISPFTFEVLSGLHCPFTGIFGNNDGDRVLLREKSGGALHFQPYMLTLGGRSIVIVHEPMAVEALAKSGMYDIVLYGHTHIPEMRKVGDTLVVNPGKLARLHKGKSTLALIDTDKLDAEFVELS